jgi:FKBP-type peptidyl-prolyl cis-trans isomerase
MLSYAFGVDVGANMKRMGVQVDMGAFVQGIRDTLEGRKLRMTPYDLRDALQEFSRVSYGRKNAEMTAASAAAKKAGTDFLAANAKKAGVVALPSGLQYKVVKEGSGPRPKASDRVTMHFSAALIDGAELENSRKGGEPAVVAVDGAIAGWTEGLQLMGVGSVYTFYIPPQLAYGERVRPGGPIPPNATLVYEIELLSIVK